MSTVTVNGTTLYYERRGHGPPVLFISGASGDAGLWTSVAETLARDYTIVSYDRRGNSRSVRQPAVGPCSIDEQADDAAALLRALDLAPAFVYGSSLGAVILISLVLRHPEVVRGAVFHEPPLVAVTSNPHQVADRLKAIYADGMADGGPTRAMEYFLEWIDSDAAAVLLRGARRERVLDNGGFFFSSELAGAHAYGAAQGSLASVHVPCTVAAAAKHRDLGEDRHWLYEAAQWLGDSLQAPFLATPGSHLPQLTHPKALAALLATLFTPGAAVPAARPA